MGLQEMGRSSPEVHKGFRSPEGQSMIIQITPLRFTYGNLHTCGMFFDNVSLCLPYGLPLVSLCFPCTFSSGVIMNLISNSELISNNEFQSWLRPS